MMDWNDGYHWQWGMTMGIFMLLFWFIAIAALVFFVRWLVNLSHRNNSKPGRFRAQELLDERLARGEISVAEYRERSAALREGG